MLGGYLAIAIQNMQWQERAADAGTETVATQKEGERVADASHAGANGHDQVRVLTPEEAIAKGADYLVIGRPLMG